MKVRHCCSKKECFKKITLKDQKTAHKNFYELESTAKQDSYLINCIEHVQTNRASASEHTKECGEAKDKSVDRSLLEAASIQLEIENESNGNQMLSDEIQKAIKESLKDCMVNQVQKEDDNVNDELEKRVSDRDAKENSEDEEDAKTQYWNYYIVIDRCRKRVCLQFLLKLFRITKARIKALQGKILSGTYGVSNERNAPGLVKNPNNLQVSRSVMIPPHSRPTKRRSTCGTSLEFT